MTQTKEPIIIYGTAWKEDATAQCVADALSAGFRAIDTANQRKHYDEAAVGRGIRNFLARTGLTRADLFIQSKFTYARGQDHRLPYDPAASLREQVAQSFQSSLEHLQTERLDSYLLHGFIDEEGLTEQDLEVWQAMEGLYRQQKVGAIGVANCSLLHLQQLWTKSTIKPHYVQNRCFAELKWDEEVRVFCAEKQIRYQAFSVLTANTRLVLRDEVAAIARKYNKTIPQVVFRFGFQLGLICLTGTTKKEHMLADQDIHDFTLTTDEMQVIENIAG